ncbi:hypothetical protein GW17_00014757 [Ensete ventricosum]|nr:hypothetical protein GW17_00014757 [Ensete ventricosum]
MQQKQLRDLFNDKVKGLVEELLQTDRDSDRTIEVQFEDFLWCNFDVSFELIARIALPSGKALYRVVRTGPSADQYADCPLLDGTVKIDRRWSISAIGGRLREKEGG